MNDYIAAKVWSHGLDEAKPGIRVMASVDTPGALVMQIRDYTGRVHNAVLTTDLLADLHRQAMTA